MTTTTIIMTIICCVWVFGGAALCLGLSLRNKESRENEDDK